MVERRERSTEDGWERHRREQLRAWRRATPAQRLARLEELIELARRAGTLPPRRNPPSG